MLKHKKEAAAAVAEAETLEAAADAKSERHSCDLNIDSVPLEASQRTKQYVLDQLKERDSEFESCKSGDMQAKTGPVPNHNVSPPPLKPEVSPSAFPTHHFRPQNHLTQPPPARHAVLPDFHDGSSHINDFVRYLARRELVATGLLQFNDKPQNYRAWRRSFLTTISGLNLTQSEEMDLLLKWLGKESAEHIEQIRAIHINRPEAGLAMAWERLELTYGSAEAIENALFKRIDSFPKIINRDGPKLTKLGDLLMELQAAKAEGDLPGLAFLDTARGVNPIVQKLPSRLQDKWVIAGAAYKSQNKVNYPPFGFFVDFVSQQACIANDPSFSLIGNPDTAPRTEKTAWKPNRQREVSVHKTEVSPRATSDTGEPPTKSDDSDKLCLLHKKPHPLRKCRAFREKTIDERKTLLKENNVCFKCLSSSSHIAKNCRLNVQCLECKSDRHNTALHPGPAAWQQEAGPASEHGGEEDAASSQSQITNKCTKVCGGELTDRSCSKICLIKVFPTGHREKAVKLYAIMDEQSNRSLVRSQFFDMFNDQSPSAPYTLRTCAGVKQSAGRRATGYEVESLDGTVRVPLPSLIECNDIPNNREEIPTPEVALHHDHLSAQYDGISLNNVLLTGPDLNNTLQGVLIRFRREAIAITADIEQMFYCFRVREKDRNFLRFLWFQNNDLSKAIVDYRMNIHVFGNSPSPAVAIHGLHKSVQGNEFHVDPDVQHFVLHDFYVDDGLKSLPTVQAAISLLKRTQDVLSKSNLRLHKIAANNNEVMDAFPSSDHASDLKDLDLDADELPLQRSLGLDWNLKTDCFLFNVSSAAKPYTRRGVLSTINSLYDPLGFVAPVTVQGKAILRELTAENGDWDAPLPSAMEDAWTSWRASLSELAELPIPRRYTEASPSAAVRRELCVFCDASVKAIGAVCYLKVTDSNGNNQVGFVMGKAKLAPRPEHTVPRLELCAAVLAVELADLVSAELDLQLDDVTYYSDSKVVLGYICNETRRFYVYVSNRVLRIRRSSRPDQWRYVPTDLNPADHATRSIPAGQLKHTNWLSGPKFLSKPEPSISDSTYDLVDPSTDPDIRPLVSALSTTASNKQLDSQRFAKFSTWKSLIRAVTRLVHIACHFKTAHRENGACKGWHYCKAETVEESEKASAVIIQAVQQEVYSQEIKCIQKQEKMPKSSPLRNLDPFIDTHGLLRVGGRLRHSNLDQSEKTPLIIPGQHHIATLLIRHHHEQIHHQGRHFTEGAVRSAGLWVVGGKKRVSSIIHQCMTCRRLRAPLSIQKMANLPADRLSTDPPFSSVGLDVFGPWNVSSRRTRGGFAQSKRWAVIFTCMSIRAVHIEVIESLDTSSFINALRRFLSVRGPVKHIRSDRGTNFIGACKELKMTSNIDSIAVKTYLSDKGCTWSFNPPHASHWGGSWERMIGLARRILDAMFLRLKDKLTHEVLVTFMAEVAAIINARPLVPVTMDPDDSFILTPAALLTQKANFVPAPAGEFGVADLYKSQWRQVQHLSNTFWDRWRKQFLPTLQARKRWQSAQPNIPPGSVVLFKNSQAPRNEWPLGLITQAFPSKDGKVRQVEVKIIKPGGTSLFLRSVNEIVLLLPPEAQ
ncbi:uncharacterized protein LOC118566091 isoform X1 [Fundulus heteroclitus]|uniref:uncharacterized protein LOC118566091 isoform X1 n=3 Tax=Fundulus heteroclitus TaxID=8078 RepID=UPI00165BABA5|nr:uncharacterized protein LOC118566091 isoform X1 [Fundulus heteroclitus]